MNIKHPLLGSVPAPVSGRMADDGSVHPAPIECKMEVSKLLGFIVREEGMTINRQSLHKSIKRVVNGLESAS